jgi:methionine-rich copper-binding protein CopC
MKTLFTIILSALIFTTASANNFEGIKIGTTGKSSIEAKFSSVKATTATITITNQAGVVVNTQNVTLVKGNNTVSLLDVTTLEEGAYTISLISNGTTTTTTFVNFKATEAL